MNTTPERPAAEQLRNDLAGAANIELHPIDLKIACQQYIDNGYEVTSQTREFLSSFGELTVTWQFRSHEVELTTSVERTLESTHASLRNVRFFARCLGQTVALVGTAFDTEESLLLAEDGDILLYGDAGFQRVANGFENAIRALVTGDWDKTFFKSVN